jgi:hypothetical protein
MWAFSISARGAVGNAMYFSMIGRDGVSSGSVTV